MKYGDGPPDGFSRSQWASVLRLQNVPDKLLSPAQRKLLARSRLWDGEDPHASCWTTREKHAWDAMIYGVPAVEFELQQAA